MSDLSATVMDRARIFWRRALSGPSARARVGVYEQLAALLQAGFPLRRALSDLDERGNAGAQRVVRTLLRAVDDGQPLGPEMEAHPELFSRLEASLVGTGELSGKLVEALRVVAERVEAERRVRTRLLMGAAYPAFLAHFALVPAAVIPRVSLVYFVVPLVALWIGVPLVISLHVGLRDTPGYARALSRIPVLGTAFRAGSVSRFAWSFAALYEAGAAPDVCLERGADAARNGWLAQDVRRAARLVREGNAVAGSLAAASSLPGDLRALLETGEESGSLGDAAQRAARLYDERRDARVKAAIGLMPAVLVILLGVVVFVLGYQAMVAPLADLLDGG